MPRRGPVPESGVKAVARASWARVAEDDDALLHLLDDDPAHLSVEEWRARNLALHTELVRRGLVDAKTVPAAAHRFLTETLISRENPAATDPLNAGHVRAQNANVLHYGLALGLDARRLAVALEAAFIHDLNKAVGEELRRDRYAVRRHDGRRVERQETVAACVGLNHLGERTRAALARATKLPSGRLSAPVAEAIDRCIVHHGLGSSRFIQRLVDGDNEWWGSEFVDPKTGTRLLVHPPMPPLSLESVVHDLADSTQQMQGGVAWLLKYPEGFWREAGLSYWQMLSDPRAEAGRGVAGSLARQIALETATSESIILTARFDLELGAGEAKALKGALARAVRSTARWIDDRPGALAQPRGSSVYHDVARALGGTPKQAKRRLESCGPGDPQLDAVVWRSARALDLRRLSALARAIEAASVR